MKRIFYLFFLSLFFTPGLQAQTPGVEYQSGWLYLKLQDTSTISLDPYAGNIPALNTLFTLHGVDTIYHPFKTQDPLIDQIYKLRFSDTLNALTLINGLQALPFVDYAEKILLYRVIGTQFVPNDLQGSQWHLNKVNAPQAWDLTKGDPNITVAVIDNAVRTSHEDLNAKMYVNTGETPGNFFDDDLNGYIDDVSGWDAADLDGNPSPPASATDNSAWTHGTHCAGVVGAATDNGVGIASLGFNITVIPIKIASNSTNGNSLTAADEGIDYAVRIGADVISMSFGSPGTSLTGERMIQMANNQGITLIGAAGNDDATARFYPAAYPEVLAVGATKMSDEKSSYSNYGGWIDVMAPGNIIPSTLGGTDTTYGALSGTSMACPLVAGLAGLVVSADPSQSPSDVKNKIINGCDSIDQVNPTYIGQLGAGRINALTTLGMILTSNEAPAPVEGPELRVFPNPASNFAEVTYVDGDLGGSATIALLDLYGRVMWERTQSPGNNGALSIPAYLFSPGYYFVRVKSDKGISQEKIVIGQ